MLEQLLDISRTAVRIDHINTGSEVVEAMRVFCKAAIDADSKYLGGFRYLREIGMLALDRSRGIIHSQLLLSVSNLFRDLILSAKEKDRYTHTMFSIMQFFILGRFL